MHSAAAATIFGAWNSSESVPGSAWETMRVGVPLRATRDDGCRTGAGDTCRTFERLRLLEASSNRRAANLQLAIRVLNPAECEASRSPLDCVSLLTKSAVAAFCCLASFLVVLPGVSAACRLDISTSAWSLRSRTVVTGPSARASINLTASAAFCDRRSEESRRPTISAMSISRSMPVIFGACTGYIFVMQRNSFSPRKWIAWSSGSVARCARSIPLGRALPSGRKPVARAPVP